MYGVATSFSACTRGGPLYTLSPTLEFGQKTDKINTNTLRFARTLQFSALSRNRTLYLKYSFTLWSVYFPYYFHIEETHE